MMTTERNEKKKRNEIKLKGKKNFLCKFVTRGAIKIDYKFDTETILNDIVYYVYVYIDIY